MFDPVSPAAKEGEMVTSRSRRLQKGEGILASEALEVMYTLRKVVAGLNGVDHSKLGLGKLIPMPSIDQPLEVLFLLSLRNFAGQSCPAWRQGITPCLPLPSLHSHLVPKHHQKSQVHVEEKTISLTPEGLSVPMLSYC